MNLNFIYSAVVTLNFVVKFHVSLHETQNYFLLSGPNSTAHLYRENQTLWLDLSAGREHTMMYSQISGATFTFDWSGKTVDKQLMSNFSNIELWFDAYTFLSPILEMQHPPTPVESIFQCGNINYKLMALLIFSIGLALKFDLLIPTLLKLLGKEDIYVNMESRV